MFSSKPVINASGSNVTIRYMLNVYTSDLVWTLLNSHTL